MGVRIGTGLSTEPDARVGATEAAAGARDMLGGRSCDLAVVFVSGAHLAAPEATLEAIHETLAARPDAVVLDWWMPHGGGPTAARQISHATPETAIIAFSAYGGATPSGEMLEAGAKAYLVKSERSSDEIIEAIRRAASRARSRRAA